MLLCLTALADALEAGIARASADVELEQAAHGLDARKEVALHPMLEQALVEGGYDVAREQRYPTDRARSQRTHGRRCDLVVTRGGPVAVEEPPAELFAQRVVPHESALWLEVKVLAQFVVGGPNRTWTSSLMSPPTKDIEKLARETSLAQRGLLLVLFTASVDVAEHDLGIWQDHVLRKGMPLRAEAVRHVPIGDRRGNTVCTAALFSVGRTSLS